MKHYPMSSTISCLFCDEFVVDVTPWISGRVLTWPHPIAHLIFLYHRRRHHHAEWLAWRIKYADKKKAPASTH